MYKLDMYTGMLCGQFQCHSYMYMYVPHHLLISITHMYVSFKCLISLICSTFGAYCATTEKNEPYLYM